MRKKTTIYENKILLIIKYFQLTELWFSFQLNWNISCLLLVALCVMDLTCEESPADYQRKFSGRTLWKMIQTDVEELLPLPSFNLDTKVEQQPSGAATIKSNSKVAALQQLLRWAPDAIQEGSFDKCKHPLHSWMCQKNVARTTQPPLTTTSLPPPTTTEEPRLPEASNLAEMTMIPVTPPPAKPYTRKPEEADLCSNPFYSWRCNPEEPQSPEASNLAEKQLILEAVTTTPTPKPSTEITSGWDRVDPCTHAFHSWLCKPAPKPRTILQPTVIPSLPEASNKMESIEAIYIPPPPVMVEQEASNSEDSSTVLYLPPPESTEAPETSYIPPPPTTEVPELSYIPPPPSTEAPELYLPPPPATEAPEIYLPPPSSIEEAPEASYLPPPSSNFPPLELASSNQVGNRLIPDTAPEPTAELSSVKSGWDGVDPCSHPFHSWLCNRSGNSGNSRNAAQNSWKRLGRQSTAWAIDSSEDTIYDLANFEPMRIPKIWQDE